MFYTRSGTAITTEINEDDAKFFLCSNEVVRNTLFRALQVRGYNVSQCYVKDACGEMYVGVQSNDGRRMKELVAFARGFVIALEMNIV